MTKAMEIHLGNAIDSYSDVDYYENDCSWGFRLRVRILIDIIKPLRQGIKLNLDGPIGGCWVPIQYEQLLDFCYHCGLLNHVFNDCESYFTAAGSLLKRHQYGPWFRYQGSLQYKQKQSHHSKSSSYVQGSSDDQHAFNNQASLPVVPSSTAYPPRQSGVSPVAVPLVAQSVTASNFVGSHTVSHSAIINSKEEFIVAIK